MIIHTLPKKKSNGGDLRKAEKRRVAVFLTQYLERKVALCYIHRGLTVMRVQVQQMVIFNKAESHQESTFKRLTQDSAWKRTNRTLETNKVERALWFAPDDTNAVF